MSKNQSGNQMEAAAEVVAAEAVENREVVTTERVAEKKTAKAKHTAPVVYCGPTVRGVAKQYTVYSRGIPDELVGFIQKYPEAAGLVVPVESFAQMRKKLEDSGTVEAILYRKIKTEM